MEHEEKFEVVKSTNIGVGQHDAMSWEVLGTKFVYTDRVAEQSLLFDETMRAWIAELDMHEREEIVNAIFEILEDLNIRTVDDLARIKFKDIQEAMKLKKSLPEETQKLLAEAVKLLWKTTNQAVKQYVKEKIESRNTKK